MPHKSVNDTICIFFSSFFLWKKTFKVLLATVYYVIVNFCLYWNFLSFFLFVEWVKKILNSSSRSILNSIQVWDFFSFLEIYYDREKVILSLVHSKWDWNWSQNWPPGSNRRARRDFKSTILLLQFWSNFSNP